MLLCLLFVVITQLWCPVTCPPLGFSNGNMTFNYPGPSKYEVFKKNGYIPNLYTMVFTKKIPRQDEDENDPDETTTTALPSNVTREYWNTTHERCDYERIRCMRAYATGAVCGRTLYYQYYSFPNFCALDFHNCIGRYDDIWTLAYMGICTEIDIEKTIYVDLNYDQMTNTSFLTQMYTADSGDLTNVG